MLSEQQQRIMGYFIEEAKDHLNTIEQGLLNLQATIADPEMASEVFRAAHSVKGGAAMLGLDSIQHTSHRLEDYFKVLKECPLQVDQKLETLLLRVFDSLQELLEQLQGPFGLTEDKAAAVMTEAEPVFTQLNQHLSNLVRQSGATPPDDVQLAAPTAAAPAETPAVAFGREVPARLRDMLAQFKQADTAATREQLQEICRSLGRLGERFSLPQWSELIALAQQAIASTDNSYRALAPVLIKDIKQAHELVMGGRSSEIQPSADLQRLVPVSAEPDLLDLLTPDEAEFSAPLFDFEPLPDTSDALPVDEATPDWFSAAAADSTNGAADLTDDFDSLSNSAPQTGPEVGLAELNSLADLFEGELPDLGLSWQEEVVGDENSPAESLDLDSTSDFSDLLFDQPEPTLIPAEDEDLSGLLSSAADNSEADSELSFDLFAEPAAAEAEAPELDLSGLAFTDAIEPAIEPARPEALGDLNGLFADIEPEAPASSDAAALDDLFGDDADGLFAAEPEAEPTFGDAFANLDLASLDLDADAPADSIGLDDPFDLSAIDSVAPLDAELDAESDAMDGILGSIDAIELEPAAADAPWQDAELTSDLWDSSGLSLEAVAALDDPFAPPSEPPTQIGSSADPFTELSVDAAPVDIEALDFDLAGEDAIASSIAADDPLGLDLTPTPESTLELTDESTPELADDLLDFDAALTREEDSFDLNDLLSESDAPTLEADAKESLDDALFLPDASAIDAPSLEDASLDALFGSSAEAAIDDDAAFADLLAPTDAEAEASDFDLLLEEPTPIAPLPLDPATPIESADFDLLELESDLPESDLLNSSESDALNADLFGLPGEVDSTADESDLWLEQSEAIASDPFDLTADAASAEPPEASAALNDLLENDLLESDLLEPVESDAIDDFFSTAETQSNSDEQLLELPAEFDSLDENLFDLTSENRTASEESDDLALLLDQPDSDSLDADLFGLTTENRAESSITDDTDDLFGLTLDDSDSIESDDLFDLTAEASPEASPEASNSIESDDLFDLTAEASDSIATDDLFGSAIADSETPLLDLNESDLSEFDLSAEQLSLDRELDSIEIDASSEDPLLAFDLEETDESGSLEEAADLDLFADIDADIDIDANDIDAGVGEASSETIQNTVELPNVELPNFDAAIDPALTDPQAGLLADSDLEFDFDALAADDFQSNSLESTDFENLEADGLASDRAASAEDLFDLSPADADSVFDLDAIESSAEEIEPFDLDAALMEEAIEPAAPETDAFNSADLDDLFALEDTAATDSIETDNFDLLMAAETPLEGDRELDQETNLDDLDALLMADAIDLPDELAANEFAANEFAVDELAAVEAISPDDFAAAFGADLTAPSIETDDFANLAATLPDEEAELDALLADDLAEDSVTAAASAQPEDFADLEALLESPIADSDSSPDDFADLAALLEPQADAAIASGFSVEEDAVVSGFADDTDEEFANLDALLSDAPAAPANEFDDLEKLLENADQTLGGSPSERGVRRPSLISKKRSPGVLKDQNMRVSVKNLDNLNNLVGELVVNRNSLEQTQERVRQFLDNLVYQVQQLSDVGQRMRDLYERSLLESSLLSSRRSYQLSSQGAAPAPASHSTGLSFDALEMDRFTGFHTLSQEMIELIVRVRESASDIDRMVDESDQITRMFRQVTTQLQEGLTRSRMVPFDQTAARMPRAVRDISLKCGKQAELVVEGKETLIDKMILEQLYDPMTHLVNNAITHGIETPADRQAAGKPPTGRITIRAFHQGNQTVISVTDDGAGIDPEAVKRKAIEKNLITPAEARDMTRLDVYDLLFLHGFSTRDRADDFAGRGVGMDVVRTSLNEVRGTVNIDSTIGRGTTFTVRLPLTLSISKALCCISNRARIAFPMDGVEDMFDVPREQVQTDSEGRACIQWRDTLLPFQPLAELLRYSRNLGRGSVYGGNQDEDIVSVVVLRSNAGSFLALQVDQVLGEQEIVIKQLEGPVPKPVGVAGATVLGDGHIMPIADVLELIDLSQGRIRREPGSSLWEKADGQAPIEPPVAKHDPTVLIVDDSITVRELLSMTFNKVGYRVEQARDGQEAWEKLRSGLPCDLVFCDIEMPRMDGLELLSRIQKDPNLNHLPIAMLTSRGADRHRQMAVQLGAKGYFTKPYLEESLLDAAGRMLKGEVLVN